jgi:hypothetical protein
MYINHAPYSPKNKRKEKKRKMLLLNIEEEMFFIIFPHFLLSDSTLLARLEHLQWTRVGKVW